MSCPRSIVGFSDGVKRAHPRDVHPTHHHGLLTCTIDAEDSDGFGSESLIILPFMYWLGCTHFKTGLRKKGFYFTPMAVDSMDMIHF